MEISRGFLLSKWRTSHTAHRTLHTHTNTRWNKMIEYGLEFADFDAFILMLNDYILLRSEATNNLNLNLKFWMLFFGQVFGSNFPRKTNFLRSSEKSIKNRNWWIIYRILKRNSNTIANYTRFLAFKVWF